MKASPLHLEGYYIQELSVEVDAKFAKKVPYSSWSGYHFQPEKTFKPDPSDFNLEARLASNIKNPSRLRYSLKIESSNGARRKVPYKFRISLVGFFHTDKNYPEERANLLVHANAPAMLYAAAREILASVMGRGPYPALILPSASFLDDAERIAIREAKRIGPSLKSKKAGTKKASKRSGKKKSG